MREAARPLVRSLPTEKWCRSACHAMTSTTSIPCRTRDTGTTKVLSPPLGVKAGHARPHGRDGGINDRQFRCTNKCCISGLKIILTFIDRLGHSLGTALPGKIAELIPLGPGPILVNHNRRRWRVSQVSPIIIDYNYTHFPPDVAIWRVHLVRRIWVHCPLTSFPSLRIDQRTRSWMARCPSLN